MATPWPQVVLFGDSLFQFSTDVLDGFSFQGALQAYCSRRFDVVNRGLSGYNTSNALRALPQIFGPVVEGGPKMAYLVVLLGANDAAMLLPKDNQHVPLEQFKANLTKIITHPLVTAHNPKILLVTPPPLDEIRITELNLAEGHKAATRKSKVSASYSAMVRQIAAEQPSVTLIDLHKALMDTAIAKTPGFDPNGPGLGDPAGGVRGYLEQLLPDGLHMSGESYRILFKLVIQHVGQDWVPGDNVTGYPLPDWRTAPWLDSP